MVKFSTFDWVYAIICLSTLLLAIQEYWFQYVVKDLDQDDPVRKAVSLTISPRFMLISALAIICLAVTTTIMSGMSMDWHPITKLSWVGLLNVINLMLIVSYYVIFILFGFLTEDTVRLSHRGIVIYAKGPGWLIRLNKKKFMSAREKVFFFFGCFLPGKTVIHQLDCVDNDYKQPNAIQMHYQIKVEFIGGIISRSEFNQLVQNVINEVSVAVKGMLNDNSKPVQIAQYLQGYRCPNPSFEITIQEISYYRSEVRIYFRDKKKTSKYIFAGGSV